jgi:hypothetical protein
MNADEIIKEAKDNQRRYTDFFSDYRDVAREEINFVNGDAWTPEDKLKRAGRPMEVVNDAKITHRRTVEDYDQKRSIIGVRNKNYNDISSNKITIQATEGLINDIHAESLGEAVKDMAMSDLLDCGMGWYYWTPEFESGKSFHYTLKLRPILDQLAPFADIMNTREIDGSDMEWFGFPEHYFEDEFEKNWPEAEKKSFPISDKSYGNTSEVGRINVCRYYRIEYVNDTLVSVVNPFTQAPHSFHVLDPTDKEEQLIKYFESEGYESDSDLFAWLNDSNRILADRDVQRKTVEWYLLTDSEVLDEGTIGGEFIPAVPMLGPRYEMDGKIFFDSLSRQSKGPARLNNFVISNYVETMSAQPIAPYVTDWRKIKNHLQIWSAANITPTMALPFDPVTNEDQTVDISPPMGQPQADVPAGWATLAQMSQEAKTRTSGLPDSALGLQGNEVSGDALEIRTSNSLANRSIFFKCRHLSDELLGKQLIKAIPVYWDSERLITVSNNDGDNKMAMINKEEHDQGDNEFKGKHIDIKGSELSTFITVGPSHSSLKKESMSKLLEIMQYAGERYSDVVFPEFIKYADVIDSDKLYENCMKVAPQEIRESEEEKTPQQLEAELAQSKQEIEGLTQQNQQLEKVIMGEEQKVQSQQEIAQLKAQTELEREREKQSGETNRERMSNLTDIKEAEINARSRKEIELIKQSMGDLSSKMDQIVVALTAKSET